MSVEMVFNELSLAVPFESKQTARLKMTQFIDTLLASTSQGAKRKLCTTDSFNFLKLSDNYQVVQWRNDSEVEREERSFLRALQDRHDPPLPEIPDVSIDTNYKGTRSLGLEYAAVFEALAVSLQSEEQWNCNRLALTLTRLEETVIVEESVDVYHASSKDHVLTHTSWLKSRSRTNVIDGNNLWNRRRELLPNLDFCDSTAEQLTALQQGDPMLRSVVSRLFELEDYCQKWQAGPFSPLQLPCKVTPDSQTTLQQYGSERTFLCPDGQQKLFSWHVRLTPLAWRIYFIPQEPRSSIQAGKIVVGYIGSHLRTVRFN